MIQSRIVVLGLVLAAFPSQSNAQQPPRVLDPNAHGWYMYFGDHPIHGSRWGVHLEGQWRRHNVITRWQQLLLRPGINYELNPNVMLTATYAFINTHRYGEFPAATRFPEHRLAQQVLLRHSAGRVGFQHRYRLEQRFLGEVSLGTDGQRRLDRWRHENRFRYMMRAAIPLRGPRWYTAFYNELFVNFGANVAANVFDQNRAYAALGRNLRPHTRIEAGYMNQLVQQRNGRVFEVNHTLQVSVSSVLPFGRN